MNLIFSTVKYFWILFVTIATKRTHSNPLIQKNENPIEAVREKCPPPPRPPQRSKGYVPRWGCSLAWLARVDSEQIYMHHFVTCHINLSDANLKPGGTIGSLRKSGASRRNAGFGLDFEEDLWKTKNMIKFLLIEGNIHKTQLSHLAMYPQNLFVICFFNQT